MAGEVGKREKDERSQKVLDIFAYVLTGFAIISAFAAVVFASLWFATSWYTPYENYKELQEIVTAGGQYLKIEYPKRVLANNKPANLVLTLNGPINGDKAFKIIFPGEIRLLGYQENASKREIARKFTDSDPDGRVVKITFFHSRTIEGFGWYSNQIITIKSTDLNVENLPVKVQMETVGWARAREFVNSSVGDKSPLILLASGLISWAGTYLLQFIKDKRERQKDIEQRQREDGRKYEEDLLSAFPKNPALVIRGFVADCKKGGSESFREIYAKLEIAGCHRILTEKIFVLWQIGSFIEARLMIDDILYLNEKFPTPLFSDEVKLLEQLQEMTFLSDSAEIQQESLKCVLKAFVLWGESVKPFLLPIIKNAVAVHANLPTIHNVFGIKDSPGLTLLRDAKIQGKLAWYWENHEQLLAEHQSANMTDDDKKRAGDERLVAARSLYSLLSTDIIWRPLWQSKETKVSSKMRNWLNSHDLEAKNPSFGEELAELDGDARRVDHPVLEHVGLARPLLMFGGEGIGKTSAAYHLMDVCRNPKPDKYSGAFPIYTVFQSDLDVREWLIAMVARALIDFISDNPRHFLNAESVQRVAMGRLISFHAGTLDKLKITFKRSGHTSNDDWAQILTQLKDVVSPPVKRRMTDAEVVDLLYMARPDGFYRTFFILDVSNMSISSKKINLIKELVHLILPLTQIDFFIKAFLPVELKPSFDKALIESLGADLRWDERLLQEMLKLRFERFAAICDSRRTVKDPFELIVSACSWSPRKAIRYGNALLLYAEENLDDFQKLDAKAFTSVWKVLVDRGALTSTGAVS